MVKPSQPEVILVVTLEAFTLLLIYFTLFEVANKQMPALIRSMTNYSHTEERGRRH